MNDRRKRTLLPWRGLFRFVFLLLLFSATRLWFAGTFRPILVSKPTFPAMEATSENPLVSPAILETVIFPEEALVFLKYPRSARLFTEEDIKCVYLPPNSSQPELELTPAAVDFEEENRLIVRCQLPPRGTILSIAVKHNGILLPGLMHTWDSLVYEALIDERDNSTLVFVKGLNLRSGRVADPARFKCVFGSDLSDPVSVLWGEVVTVAQEVVRCHTPVSILEKLMMTGSSFDPVKVSVRVVGRRTVDSIARLKYHQQNHNPNPNPKHKMCVCTMLRNQARFLPEWIMYHARIGVDRWFIYDNNSDDDLESVVMGMGQKYNITRHLWPWIKTQEAGFSHCAIRARDSCEWVAFIDVDEFFHLPSGSSLQDVVSKQSEVAEIRVWCHSFGPSGLKKVPERGVMAGYTCRLAAPERHKSIIRPEALNSSLINFVHHFHLKAGLRHVNMNRSVLVINHYKYQVWEVFKEKFYRRVATYVSDWRQERNVGSKDRAPGLGTKAVEPLDWSTRFCEVTDTRLKDRILDSFVDPETGYLPWEEHMSKD